MKFLTELLKVSRLQDNEDQVKEPELNVEYDNQNDKPDPDSVQDMGAEFDDEMNVDEEQPSDEFGEKMPGDELDDEQSEEPVDPNRAGLIRYVKGAHLVYKREQEDGTYEEMWIYNSGEFKNDIKVKKAILSGTDIPPNATRSPDGSQTVKMWSAGNADIVVINGLVN
jgi:hypothetical protein